VLSDFPEYILVAKSNDTEEVIENHNEIQQVVREKLNKLPKTVISNNLVNRFSTSDNRECIEFLLNIRDSLGFSKKFDLMIDASSTDLVTDQGYRFIVTDNAIYSKDEFLEYWLDIIKQYSLRFLEDPFHEVDFENWQRLTVSQESCKVIGDNFYSSDAGRLEQGVEQRYTHGVIIKPNQAGTVTDVCRAIEVAQQAGQIVITSHRSISTESTFLSLLTCIYGVRYIKIGPFHTDYSAVLRFNEIIRITEA
jgi:enolase